MVSHAVVPSKSEPDHIVVLQYTEKAGGYCGVITWTAFDSKQHFETWKQENPNALDDQKVIAEGVTQAEAIRMCRSTTIESRVRALMDEATDPDTGIVDEDLLEMSKKDLEAMRLLGLV
jgi:hypothetical protein